MTHFIVDASVATEILITCGLVAITGFMGDVIVSAIKRDIGLIQGIRFPGMEGFWTE